MANAKERLSAVASKVIEAERLLESARLALGNVFNLVESENQEVARMAIAKLLSAEVDTSAARHLLFDIR